MGGFKVEIRSKDMIRPSSPTPSHLKTVQFSFLDQFATPVHMPFIFYYQKPVQNHIALLKKSLSDTLVEFYPLAGRIQGNVSIHCNDQGVAFYEADVSASLAQLLQCSDSDDLLSLLSISPFTENSNTIVAGIQVNQFRCGGIAVGVSITHKIADAATYSTFVAAWANTARSGHGQAAEDAKFDGVSIFPPNVDLSKIAEAVGVCKGKIVTRRLIFDKDTIVALKKRVHVGSGAKPPTRVEAVSAFIWERFIKAASAKKPRPPKIVSASQIVNLRKVAGKNSHGNVFWSTFAHEEVNKKPAEAGVLVEKLRAAVKDVDKSYLEKIKRGDCRRKSESWSEEEAEVCNISSCIRFPFYEADFGWGRPIWVSMAPLPFKNTVVLMGTNCGQGIEAWVNVLEYDVAVAALEQDPEFVSLQPSYNILRPKL